MYIIPFQDMPLRNIRAMAIYPKAQATCTPTAYLCRLLPKQTSLIIEKQSVIEGLEPNPIRKRPMPNMLGELDKQASKTPTVPIPHAILKANLDPKLSATNGMTKKPKRLPRNIISCSTETVFW